MSRVQLALNVADIDEAVDFYSKLLGAGPAKRESGYANFAISDPPLKLVLLEVGGTRGHGVAGALNHLGVEVESSTEVVRANRRLDDEGLATELQGRTTCCFATQDKVWVRDPDGAPWEIYTVLADVSSESGVSGDGTCCTATPDDPVPATLAAATSDACSCC